MKIKFLLTALFVALPLSMMAQDDDMYFVPKKKDKTSQKVASRSETQKAVRSNFSQFDESAVDGEHAPDYHVGKLRSDDEYNRRGRYSGNNYGEVHIGSDTIYVTDEEPLNSDNALEEDEYNYSGRLVRFYGGIRSPYYWDYYYDWAFFDPWFYGPGFYYGYHGWYTGWYGPWHHYGWYDPWYHYGWYDPWYHPWFGGGWVGNHHPVAGTSGSRYGGRRGINGISSGRGTRGNLASSVRGNRFDYARGSMSTSSSARTSTGRISSNRNTRLNDGTLSSRTNRTSTSTPASSNRTSRLTTSSSRNERTYTPTTSSRSYNSSSSSNSSFSSGSSSSRGGGFSGGGRSSGGGGGRGGR